jgi:UDP-GlcNAc:undecaprenyl-phosphate GlcNAc-1-phosphate transferase
MRSYVATFFVAALVAAVLTPLVLRVAMRLGKVDRPGGRRVHKRSTPRLGGIGICLAFFVPLILLSFVRSDVADQTVRFQPLYALGVAVGGLAMCGLGLVDDWRGLRARYKLAVQVLVAIGAFAVGFRIDAITIPWVGPLPMGIFALPITVLWIVGVVNAVNLIDGLDGLAAGVVFFAGLTNFVVAYLSGSAFVALMMASVMGSVLGFLFYNFNPARIFMGDSGSYFLGFVLATSSLLGGAQKASTSVALLVPMIALGVPIFDTLFAIVRRYLERRPIMSADRGHLHHRLLDMGLTHRRAVLLLYGVSVLFTLAAIALYLGRAWQVGVAILASAVVVIGLVRFVGYFEYMHLRRRQKDRLRSRHTEALRGAVPVWLKRLAEVGTHAQLAEQLLRFCEASTLISAEVLQRDADTGAMFRWERPEAQSEEGTVVTARYPLGPDGTAKADVRFAWVSEAGDVSPQVEILLQVFVDGLATCLTHVASPWAAERAAERAATRAADRLGAVVQPH